MELRGNTITLGELLDDPGACALLRRQFGPLLDHPLVRACRSLTLAQLTRAAAGRLPPVLIRDTLEALRRL